jgi:malonyl-CoA/methylmalonyl-CoA synthetase
VPKGIMLTHSNLLRNTEALVEAWGFTEADRLLHALPIFHVHGLFVATGCVLLSGSSMRWLPAFDAQQVIRFLPECTVLMGVPTYYTRLLAEESFTAATAKNARLFISGSAPLLEETFAEFEQRTGQRILERYGMTETNMNTSNPLDGERRPGTVGPPLPGVEVRICDDDGKVVEEGEIGNLQVRGPNVFIGYWKMPEKTTEDFTGDGFFNTGDKPQRGRAVYRRLAGHQGVSGHRHPACGLWRGRCCCRRAGDWRRRCRSCDYRNGERKSGQLQGAETCGRRRRIATQHDGEGAEKRIA